MSKRKISPLVQAMNLFAQMDERDRQTLADYIRTQTATPRKASTKKAKKETPLLPDELLDITPCVYQHPEDSPFDGACGVFANNGIHDPALHYTAYHPFVPPAPSAAKKSSRKKDAAPGSIPSTEGEMMNVLGVGASGGN